MAVDADTFPIRHKLVQISPKAYEHPADRIGDLTVASDARTALGKARAKHDLSLVETGLRSHGGSGRIDRSVEAPGRRMQRPSPR